MGNSAARRPPKDSVEWGNKLAEVYLSTGDRAAAQAKLVSAHRAREETAVAFLERVHQIAEAAIVLGGDDSAGSPHSVE